MTINKIYLMETANIVTDLELILECMFIKTE